MHMQHYRSNTKHANAQLQQDLTYVTQLSVTLSLIAAGDYLYGIIAWWLLSRDVRC